MLISQNKSKIKTTCFEKYGVHYSLQSQEVRDKGKATCLEKYGVEHAMFDNAVKNKIKETCLEKYGVEHAMFDNGVKNKIKETCLEKYGVENPSQSDEIKEKKKETSIKNYGVEHPLQSDEIKQKLKNTCLTKYGVESPMQFGEVAEYQLQNSYKLKTYTFPCAKTIQVQGYEPFLLDILVKKGYIFEDIITKRTEVPEIWYDQNNKRCRYYCDVYIPKTNTIYEVKSTWTYQKDIDKNNLKKQACLDAGYNFELYVFDNKGIRQLLD